jgi:hypothetical protein
MRRTKRGRGEDPTDPEERPVLEEEAGLKLLYPCPPTEEPDDTLPTFLITRVRTGFRSECPRCHEMLRLSKNSSQASTTKSTLGQTSKD